MINGSVVIFHSTFAHQKQTSWNLLSEHYSFIKTKSIWLKRRTIPNCRFAIFFSFHSKMKLPHQTKWIFPSEQNIVCFLCGLHYSLQKKNLLYKLQVWVEYFKVCRCLSKENGIVFIFESVLNHKLFKTPIILFRFRSSVQ